MTIGRYTENGKLYLDLSLFGLPGPDDEEMEDEEEEYTVMAIDPSKPFEDTDEDEEE